MKKYWILIGIILLIISFFPFIKQTVMCFKAPCPPVRISLFQWLRYRDNIKSINEEHYENPKYNFKLTLSDAWKNHKVFSTEGSQGVGAPTFLAFAVPTSDKTKCVMNVNDQICGYVAPFAITIIAKDRDNTSTVDGKLGEDATYAYYYSLYAHFNELPSDLSNINFDIPKIISTFKFTK